MLQKRKVTTLMWIGGLVLAGIAGCGGDSNDLTNNGGLPNGSATQSQIMRGRYLVTAVGACADCHNAQGGNNPNDPNWLSGYHEGTQGQPFQIGPFKTYPSNLTPDSETGLGTWTPQQIFNALRDGKDDEGQYLCPPMPWPALRNMTDDDIWSVVAYLRSIKPVKNAVPESEGPGAAPGQHGDWSSAYTNLQPLPAYPGTNETGGTP